MGFDYLYMVFITDLKQRYEEVSTHNTRERQQEENGEEAQEEGRKGDDDVHYTCPIVKN